MDGKKNVLTFANARLTFGVLFKKESNPILL